MGNTYYFSYFFFWSSFRSSVAFLELLLIFCLFCSSTFTPFEIWTSSNIHAKNGFSFVDFELKFRAFYEFQMMKKAPNFKFSSLESLSTFRVTQFHCKRTIKYLLEAFSYKRIMHPAVKNFRIRNVKRTLNLI